MAFVPRDLTAELKNKKVVMIGGGIVILFLLYRYAKGRSGTSSSTTGTTSDESGAATPDSDAGGNSDYASLSGQEQSDVAALQGQGSDLSSALAALTGQATYSIVYSSGNGS